MTTETRKLMDPEVFLASLRFGTFLIPIRISARRCPSGHEEVVVELSVEKPRSDDMTDNARVYKCLRWPSFLEDEHEKAASFILQMVRWLLTHELQEQMTFAGKRIWHPHQIEMREET